MTKAAMQRLVKSDFFHEVKEVVRAWDFYLKTGDTEQACIMMHKWLMAKRALKHITGNTYEFSRDGIGNFSVVSQRDASIPIIKGRNNFDFIKLDT